MQINHSAGKVSGRDFLIFLGLLLLIFCFLFYKSFDPKHVLFVNDGPLGAVKAEMNRPPATLAGNWQDLSWIGGKSVSAAPDISVLLTTIFPPEILLKLYAPFTLLLLGISVWICFRELAFHRWVCLIGGLAAALNMHMFSFSAWGLGGWIIAFSMAFLAIAVIVTRKISRLWIKGILAGTAIGIGLMEGFDVGAIVSIYVGIFGLFAGLAAEKISKSAILKTFSLMAVVVVFAALTAAHTITTLVGTQVTNIAIAQQDDKTKEQRWIWATQWSLPKIETLGLLIPGVFGYRMVTGESRFYEKSYWGSIAQSPGYAETKQGLSRFSGTGEYGGIFVLLVAVIAIAQSLRKQNSPFTAMEKKFVWFWAIVAFTALLLAWGRHAPFYQFLFALPYFSTFRNPLKFMHPFHISLLFLFGYGCEALVRRYLCDLSAKTNGARKLFPTASSFEKKWVVSTGVALAAAVLGWMVYASSKKTLVAHLIKFDFDKPDTGLPAQMAEFSIGEVGWFVLFFAASVILLTQILRGRFAGKIKLACGLIIALLIADLSHADVSWIVYHNYKEKYATNPVIDILRDKPYEHRVAFPGEFEVNNATTFFHRNVYYTEWLQHHFLYYNISSIDVSQEPREASDNAIYRAAFRKAGLPGLVRMWQLTNVRYLFGLADGFVDSINLQLDPAQKRFKLHTAFNISQDPQSGAYLIETNPAGTFALIEFTGALPRAKLFSQWQVVTNDQSVLEKLSDPAFDPQQTVLVSSEIPGREKTVSTNQIAGSVQIVSYHPKRVELSADVKAPSVLLLNDKYDADWKVFVNGEKKPLLRCNYIMRGVQLEPGNQKIEFRFEPPVNTLYVSLGALCVGIVVCAFVAFGKKRKSPKAEEG